MRYLQLAVSLTVIVTALLSLPVAVSAVEVKVFTVPELIACVTTAGNVCVLQGSSYNLGGATLNVTASVVLRASGPLATITGADPVIDIQANQVVLDKIAVSGGAAVAGIRISAGGADLTFQNGRITNNSVGIWFRNTLGNVDRFRLLSAEIQNNTAEGVRFANVGPANDVVINDCVFQSNGGLGQLRFSNDGDLRNLAIRNSTFQFGFGAADGLAFLNGGGVRDAEISSSRIEGNQGAGLHFGGGPVDCLVINNSQINANNLHNAWFDPAVGSVRNVTIESSSFNVSLTGDGLFFQNNGSLDDLALRSNDIERNANAGIRIMNVGPFTRAEFTRNTVRNNRALGLLINHSPALGGPDFRVGDLTFSGNIFNENGIGAGGLGAWIETGATEIAALSFAGDQFSKNSDAGLLIATDTGEIAEVALAQLKAEESQLGAGATIQTTDGAISAVTVTGSTFKHNGLFGLLVQAGGANEVDQVSSKGSTYELNGTRAAVGQGSGLSVQADSIRTVSSEGDTAGSNNDHGIEVVATRTVSFVSVKGGTFNENDHNIDTVGDGVNVNANQDISKVDIEGCTANGNFNGFNIGSAGNQIGQQITVKNSAANGNRNAGVALVAGQALTTATVSGNTLGQNGVGIDLEIANVGSGIEISANQIEGASGAGTGILLNSGGTRIFNNSIRRGATGVLVRRSDGNAVNQNDIVQNSASGVDGSTLGPGNRIDATSNWWGEPSGPGGVGPGLGDAVTVNVDFTPWLAAPAVVTGANFQITSFIVSPAAPDVGATVTISATVQNNGTDEGTQDITVRIRSGATVLKEERRTTPLNPAGSTTITVSYAFTAAGTYTAEVTTNNDSRSQTLTVGGGPPPPGGTIEAAIAALVPGDPAGAANPDTVIGDQEILQAISFWINGEEVPNTAGQRINDSKMLELISLWIGGTPVSGATATATAAAAGGPVASADKGHKSALTVEKIAFTGSRFIVQGQGIESIAVRVHDLAGRPVFASAALGNELEFNPNGPGRAHLANGVYLYTVMVRGFDGSSLKSEVRKMVVLR